MARRSSGQLLDAGVEVVVEHGVIRGEVRGLEVARVGGRRRRRRPLEVGVGRHDREAFAMVHGDLPDRRGAGVGGATASTRFRRPDAERTP